MTTTTIRILNKYFDEGQSAASSARAAWQAAGRPARYQWAPHAPDAVWDGLPGAAAAVRLELLNVLACEQAWSDIIADGCPDPIDEPELARAWLERMLRDREHPRHPSDVVTHLSDLVSRCRAVTAALEAAAAAAAAEAAAAAADAAEAKAAALQAEAAAAAADAAEAKAAAAAAEAAAAEAAAKARQLGLGD